MNTSLLVFLNYRWQMPRLQIYIYIYDTGIDGINIICTIVIQQIKLLFICTFILTV